MKTSIYVTFDHIREDTGSGSGLIGRIVTGKTKK